jgi:uncharacterized protein YdbL (DUF1318 family)
MRHLPNPILYATLTLSFERITTMKKLLLAFVLAATLVHADVFRVKLTSSANANGVNNYGTATLGAQNQGLLAYMTQYDCTTNAVVASTNVYYRISADSRVTNTLATVVTANKEESTTVFNPTIPFAAGDTLYAVGNATNASFKASCIFLSH